MAQLIMRSLWVNPLRLWKCKEPCRSFFSGCGTITRLLHGEVSQLSLFKKKKWWKETTSLFCTSSPFNTKTDDPAKFKLIYKFPAIRYCRALSRLKLLQTSMTALLLPPVYYYYLQGHIAEFSVLICTGTAVFAAVMLYSLSYYLRRIIGMMYVDNDLTTVKVSHLTFWGNRKNIFVPIDDVKQLSETGDDKREILRQFARYSKPDVLFFTTRYGHVLDREKFTVVFGELK